MTRVAKKPQFAAFNKGFNCFGRYQEHDLSLSDWRRPDMSLMLEVGAGSAQLSLNFSLEHPDWQVLALDRKSDRLYKVARRNSNENLAFLQADLDALAEYINLREQVELLWLAFPDPQPGKRREKHRLTHPERLDLYRILLTEEGRVRLKTDDTAFFEYSLTNFQNHPEFVITQLIGDLLQTGYQNHPNDVATLTKSRAAFSRVGSAYLLLGSSIKDLSIYGHLFFHCQYLILESECLRV